MELYNMTEKQEIKLRKKIADIIEEELSYPIIDKEHIINLNSRIFDLIEEIKR
jgi:hypothetical protein